MEEPNINVAYPQAIFIPHTSMFEDIHSSPYIIFLLPSFQTFQVKDEENCSLSIPATPPFSPYYESDSNDTPSSPPSSPLITSLPPQSPKKQRNSRSRTTQLLTENIKEVSVRVPHHRSYIDFKFYVDNNSIYFSDYAASLLLDVNQSTLRGHICQLAKRYPAWRLSGKAVGLSCNLNNMAMLNQAIREWPKDGPLFHINLANIRHFLNACRIPYEDRGTYVVMKPYPPTEESSSPSSSSSSKNKRKRDEGDEQSHEIETTTTTTTTTTEKTRMDSIDLEGESEGEGESESEGSNSDIDDL